MTRAQCEDAIIALIRAAVPAGVVVDSLPQGLSDRKALDVRGSAVWVVYVGGVPGQNQAMNALVQPETWSWLVIPLSKNYRSPQAGAASALGLLELIVPALAGAEIGAAQLSKGRDQLAGLPEGCGLTGYEIIFTLKTYLRRTA